MLKIVNKLAMAWRAVTALLLCGMIVAGTQAIIISIFYLLGLPTPQIFACI